MAQDKPAADTAKSSDKGRFLFLDNAADGPPGFLSRIQKHAIDCVPQYGAERLDWSAYEAVLLSTHCDQQHLNEITDKFDSYLDLGGTVVFNGHVTCPFLPELAPFNPLPKRDLKSLVINREAAHPLYDDIDSDQLTRRKGVAGFYGRGSNPSPPGACVLNSISPERWPVDWIYERPAGGQIFCHSGNDLWGFFGADFPQGGSFEQRLLDWLAATSKRRKTKSGSASEAVVEMRTTKESKNGAQRKAANKSVRLAALDAGLYYHHSSLRGGALESYFDEIIYIKDVADTDLSRIKTLVIPCRTNARLLAPLSQQFQNYMRQGGRLIVMGETFPDRWLPNISFIPMQTNYWWWLEKDADLGIRISDQSHSIARYITPKNAAWHLHGTFTPLHSGQVPLITTREGECLLFEDKESYAPGTLVATTLDPFYHHGSYFMPATSVFLEKFFAWLVAQQGTRDQPQRSVGV